MYNHNEDTKLYLASFELFIIQTWPANYLRLFYNRKIKCVSAYDSDKMRIVSVLLKRFSPSAFQIEILLCDRIYLCLLKLPSCKMTLDTAIHQTSVPEIYCIHYFCLLANAVTLPSCCFYLKSCFVRPPVLLHLSPSAWEGCKLHLLCIPCCQWSGGEIGFHVGSLVLAVVCCSLSWSGSLHPACCNWIFNSVFLRWMSVQRRTTFWPLCWLFTFSSFLCSQQVLLHRLNQYAVSKIDKNITEETVKVSFGHTIGV